jgi:hypothetical protein
MVTLRRLGDQLLHRRAMLSFIRLLLPDILFRFSAICSLAEIMGNKLPCGCGDGRPTAVAKTFYTPFITITPPIRRGIVASQATTSFVGKKALA